VPLEPCAIIHSTNGVVDWLDWSADFKLGIKKGTRLTTRTYAGDLFAVDSVDDRLLTSWHPLAWDNARSDPRKTNAIRDMEDGA
jgi:hypothetical protein